LIDLVGANSPVRLVIERVELFFGASVIGSTRRATASTAVGRNFVVVSNDVIEDAMKFSQFRVGQQKLSERPKYFPISLHSSNFDDHTGCPDGRLGASRKPFSGTTA